MASLLDRNIKSRLLLRDPEKATALFGKQDEETLQVPFYLLMVSCIIRSTIYQKVKIKMA